MAAIVIVCMGVGLSTVTDSQVSASAVGKHSWHHLVLHAQNLNRPAQIIMLMPFSQCHSI